ncbi:MAG: M48 family metalloprotease [Jiangellaceae bacterium]
MPGADAADGPGPAGASPWIVLILLLAAFTIAVVVTTPWEPLAGATGQQADPSRDFGADEQARADAYQREIRPPVYLGLAVGLAVTVGLGLTPLGARLVTAAARPLGGGWVWQVLLGGLAVLLTVRAATIAFSAWAESVRRDYGISTRSWAGWVADVGRSFGLQLAGTLLAVLVLVTLARALPRWWWAVAAAAAAALVVALSFVYPLLVEPVFNRFEPLPDGELRTSLLQMAQDDGIPVDDVLVADASRRTSTFNAYVSGFGATRRIVVYDTLHDQAPPGEVRSVVAHELGHVAEHDVRNGTLLGALGAAAAVCALAGLLAWPWLLQRAGAVGVGDPRVLALVLAVVAVLGFVSGPAQGLVSRRVETRADVHALDLTRDPQTFAEMQRSLALGSHADLEPPPVVFGLFASHPTAPQRIALARAWADLNDVPEPHDLAPVAGSGR